MQKQMVRAAAVLALGFAAIAPGTSEAAVFQPMPASTLTTAGSPTPVEQVQYRRGPGHYGPGYYAPRYYAGPPAYFYRPWYRRPYYGTIIGGIALGTVIGVTAYGLAPPRPRPDLCWYWADRSQTRGYWDYC